LTYYDYLNEGKGISNFIKKLSTIIVGNIFKDIKVFDIEIDISELKLINKISIEVNNITRDYHSAFFVKKNTDDDILNNLSIKFDLPFIEDVDHYYLIEIVTHELTHLYEFYNIVKNNKKLPLYNNIKKSLIQTIKQDNFDIFSYFRNIVYLTLDNELNARVSQTYQLLKFKNIKDKIQLFNILKTTHIWKKYKEIDNFNPKSYTSDLIEILGVNLTCILINDFNNELKNNFINFSFITNVSNENEIIEYFNNWNKRFKYKLKKHILKLNKVIDEVITDL
jgi:hypothetical protein